MSNDLWPAIEPYHTFTIKRDEHEIHIEQSGNPKGAPIIFLHGGPGGGISDIQRQLFDPNKYNVILFDQRGCGRSKPNACISNNTPHHLVDDIEQIRSHLNISNFHLFGGSWGSTLALLYAIQYPDRVRSMFLRGIFLGSQSEIDWIYEDKGCSHFHPEAYHELINELDSRNGVVAQYYEKLKANDSLFAAKWSEWEAINSGINVTKQTMDLFKEPNLAMSLSKISAHFFYNHLFLKPNYILDNIYKIQHIKTIIVQGQHDLLCPPKTAVALNNNMDHCNLYIIPDAGHSLFEPSLLKKVIALLNEIKV